MRVMSIKTSCSTKTGYKTNEFRAIIGVYQQNVPDGFFRDYSMTDAEEGLLISFHRDSRQPPLITVEKRRLGPDKALFVASMTGVRGEVVEVERSEKIDNFIEKLRHRILILRQMHQSKASNVFALGR